MDPKNLRILIIEDLVEDRARYKRMLIKSNFSTNDFILAETESGEIGLEMYNNEQYDCLLLGQELVDMSCTEFLMKIKDGNKKIYVPIIVMIGKDDKNIAKVALKLGGSDFLEKEFLNDQLLHRTINNVIENSKLKIKINEQQRSLFFSSKLASIGVIAAGVAHEINNPLTSVLGFSQMIERKSNQENVIQYSRNIINAAQRMKKITTHLLQYSRRSKKTDWGSVDVNRLIKDSFVLLETHLRFFNIKVELQLDQDLPPIWGEANKLESIIQNLVINSKDAIEGREDFESSNKYYIYLKTYRKGDGIKIIYKDNAGGMEEEVVNKIFDPFFTTKKAGKGTGLGMALTRDIVLEHKGTIFVNSKKDEGTIFEITLPLNQKDEIQREVGEDHSHESTEQSLNFKPSVLMIDDEEAICELFEEIFSEHFAITTFSDPLLALGEIKDKHYDIIVTDLIMTEISGKKILMLSREFSPDTPVFIISGYDVEPKEKEILMSAGAKGIISKPFDRQKVIEKLRSCFS